MIQSQVSRSFRRGFTLVEIMIVILITALLLAVAAPSFFRARNGAQATGCVHNLKQILGAKERWAMDFHKGPNDSPTSGELTPYYTKNAPICPASGVYTIGRMNQLPECSVGGVPGTYDAHILP